MKRWLWLVLLILLAVSPALGAEAHVADNAGFCNPTHSVSAGSAMITADCGSTSTEPATYTATSTADVVVLFVSCNCGSTTNVFSLTATGWTFNSIACTGATSCTSGTYGTTGNRSAAFWAVPPNTSAAAITITNGFTLGGSGFVGILVMEFSGVSTSVPIDKATALASSGSCSSTVTPSANDEAILGFCEDSTTGKGGAYTKGPDDSQQDWGEWAVISGGSGVPQTVDFTGGGTYETMSIALTSATPVISALPLFWTQLAPTAPVGNTWTTSTGWSATGVTLLTTSCNLGTGADCAPLTVPATVAGDVLYVEAFTNYNAVEYPASLSAGGSLVSPANCRVNNASTGSLGCGYVLSSTGGVTSITVRMNVGDSGGGMNLNIRSYHPSSNPAQAETVPASITNAGCSTNCTTPTVTVAGSSDLMIAAMSAQLTTCSAASPYTHFAAPSGDGVADQFNAATGTGATFTQGSCPSSPASGVAILTTVAFK